LGAESLAESSAVDMWCDWCGVWWRRGESSGMVWTRPCEVSGGWWVGVPEGCLVVRRDM
jgi:hypothetical protein